MFQPVGCTAACPLRLPTGIRTPGESGRKDLSKSAGEALRRHGWITRANVSGGRKAVRSGLENFPGKRGPGFGSGPPAFVGFSSAVVARPLPVSGGGPGGDVHRTAADSILQTKAIPAVQRQKLGADFGGPKKYEPRSASEQRHPQIRPSEAGRRVPGFRVQPPGSSRVGDSSKGRLSWVHRQ